MTLKQIKYLADSPGTPKQGDRPPGTHQDNTDGQRVDQAARAAGADSRAQDRRGHRRLEAASRAMSSPTSAPARARYTIPFAKAVAPSGQALAVDIWPELLDYVKRQGEEGGGRQPPDDACRARRSRLPAAQVDVAFFHDVFHNINDRAGVPEACWRRQLKPDGRIAIIEQEFDDPIAKKWDLSAGSHHARTGERLDGERRLRADRRVRHLSGRQEPQGSRACPSAGSSSTAAA